MARLTETAFANYKGSMAFLWHLLQVNSRIIRDGELCDITEESISEMLSGGPLADTGESHIGAKPTIKKKGCKR